MGDIVGPLFSVITLALLSSWLVTLTIITLFSYLFVKVKKVGKKPSIMDRIFDRAKVIYKNQILLFLRYKGLVVAGITVLFFISMFAFGFVTFMFFPDSDRNMITVDINLPLGTKLERTEGLVSQIDKFIA